MIGKTSLRVAVAAAMLVAGATGVSAQLGDLGDIAGGIANKLGAGKLLRGKAPVTTSIADAKWGDPGRDGFTPPGPKLAMTSLTRTPAGGFVLKPGFYELHGQSYCLHAGTHGPGAGEGYLYAPVLGSAQAIVTSILRNSVANPDISQQRVQALLWAILSRAKLQDMNADLRSAAERLLDERQLASLNRSAIESIPPSVLNRAMAQLPPIARQAMQAEARLRNLVTSPGTTYSELERVAVLTGAAPLGAGSREVASGRWSKHPDGYNIRYLPRGYSHTVTQIWVPAGAAGIGKTYDPATHVAVPGNTARQRLGQSGRPRAA